MRTTHDLRNQRGVDAAEELKRAVRASAGVFFGVEENYLGEIGSLRDEAREAAGRHQPVLFAPRVWGALSDADRGDPRALAVRYVFDAAELGRIGSEMNWGRQ